MIIDKNPELAKKLFLRETKTPESKRVGVGWGYQHALKHKNEFANYGGIDNVISNTINKPDITLQSRGVRLELQKIKCLDCTGRDFSVAVTTQDGELITIYMALGKSEESVGRKSIMKTFEDLVPNSDVILYTPKSSGPENIRYIKLTESKGNAFYLKYEKKGDILDITFEQSSEGSFNTLVSGFEQASKSQIKGNKNLKAFKSVSDPNKINVDLSRLSSL